MNGSIDPDLMRLLKRLKLGQLVPTLPERLALARAQQLDYTIVDSPERMFCEPG